MINQPNCQLLIKNLSEKLIIYANFFIQFLNKCINNLNWRRWVNICQGPNRGK